jgi:hypothetical protein
MAGGADLNLDGVGDLIVSQPGRQLIWVLFLQQNGTLHDAAPVSEIYLHIVYWNVLPTDRVFCTKY